MPAGLPVSGSGAAYGNLSLGLGGDGGKGGDGKAVTVNNNNLATLGNQITTFGDLSNGIFAQSVGGSGGAGGFAVSAGGAGYASVNLAFGGGAGSGGNADTVTVSSFGSISTSGVKSNGIFAQSLGGGGGDGGFAVSAGGAQYGALSLSLGGGGANGGQGKDVKVDSTGSITTQGDQSNGIFAQSLGGGGGNGGFAISAALTTSQISLNAALAIGGKGGTGATAGNVHVGSTGDINTNGLSSDGILAQSIGGSGGNGGFSGALGLQNGGAAVARSVGGNGGSGNNAGTVDVHSIGNITTEKANSAGIFAQSVGGGGGNGAFSLLVDATYNQSASLVTPKSVGGNGGNSSKGNTVDVTSVGTIATHGDLSDGILAQSVGGGGGRGGFSIGASLSYSGATEINSVGGNGGNSNDAGQVTVNASASAASSVPGFSIITTGQGSVGILAQSIGGGGGTGGFSVAGSFSIKDNADANAVGGSGGAGGNGSIVKVTNDGSIRTEGMNSSGIIAQSIGGGGGNGGFSIAGSASLNGGSAKGQTVGGSANSAGTGGDVTLTNNYVANSSRGVTTLGDLSYGIFGQSVGGGGGTGGFAITGALSIDKEVKSNATGGKGGAGGAAGVVTVNSGGSITTFGSGSTALVAQSIGGGGGSGGFSGALALSTGGEAATNTIGGDGAGGSNGAKVTVDTLVGSRITTFGDNAAGILAQSVGGGGGNGGFTIGASFTNGSDAKGSTNAVGGTGSGGGGGNDVGVTNRGSIETFGFLSNGIIAQSIGGGGGNGGFAVGGSLALNGDATTNTTGGKGGAGSNSGKVTVDNSGQITVNTAGTIGILAQSVGGGGGNGGFAGGLTFSTGGKSVSNSIGGGGAGGGNSDTVKVTNSAAIVANGDQGIGILAQSVGGGGGNGAFALTGGGSSSSDSATQSTGGAGAAAGNAGSVTVTNNLGGAITTNGALAYGVIAQSIGGGGGNGGFSIGGNLGLSGDATSTVGGGAGGGGGKASTVTVDNFDTITTKGIGSTGILAQSVGGGGGTGGFAIGLGFSSNGSVKNTIGGGAGGAGNTSDLVEVTNHSGATIQTLAANSIGILAQSIGGGGGAGGFVGQLGVGTGGGSSTTNAVGGSGGAGGAGGSVTVTNEGNALVHTAADNSIGIMAQSVGGGGGVGAFSIVGNASGGDASTNNVGGSGGSGGNAGLVKVTNNGTIQTDGAMSHGIYAQSVGGGGGSGGFVVSGTLNLGSGGSNTTIGGNAGNGGSGGNGGDVIVTNTGAIIINKNNSVGIFAQSVGGGGGSGGLSGALNISGGTLGSQVGGNGGKGGDGGNVTVISTGTIVTSGDNSVSVLAQSIGGGGGNSGLSLSAATANGGDFNVGGGNTGTAGSKGTVIVQVSGGMLQTGGALAYGMLAQSIGAGGGNSGASVPDPLIIGSSGITVQEGATGAIAGDSNQVQASNANVVATTGAGASGLVQQSIGGGGGTDGFTGDVTGTNIGALAVTIGGTSSGGGSGNTIQFQNTANVGTTGDNALALVVQSIGGGGGLGTFTATNVVGTATSINETVGGSEGGTNKAGILQFTAPLSGAYNTAGVLSTAVLAQSIGGGGGYAGFVATNGAAAGSAKITVGGLGGTGGAGQDFTLPSNASITTTGTGALGLVAQSIGGGGGFAGMFGVSGPTSIVLGGAGGASGNGGAVTVTTTGAISTSGTGAHALLVQSIGGGGGFAEAFATNGTALNLPMSAGVGGGGGTGGQVSVTSSAPITTTGAGAFGIIAQSIGGGGGVVGGGAFATTLPASGPFAGTVGGTGAGGIVGVTISANISTTGQDATSVFAQSDGGSGASNITVTVQSGIDILGGAGSGHAISLAGGLNNLLTNSGALTTVSGINGMTITGTTGNDSVVNNTLVIGSVDLGAGANAFDNKPTGVFDSGSTVFLGNGNLLTNEGLISPGFYLKVFTTNETGNFKQTSTGVYGLDIEFLNQTSDRINVTGSANVAGAVNINILNPGLALPGGHDLTIIHTGLGVTNSGLGITSVPTAVATYSLTFPNPDVVLHYNIDFSPQGLTINEHSVGSAINQIQLARSSPNFVPIAAALFYQPDVTALGRVYDALSGEGTSGVQQTAFSSNDQFMESIRRQTSFWLTDDVMDTGGMTLRGDGTMSYAPGGRTYPAFASVDAPRYLPRAWRLWVEGYGGGASLNGEFPLGTARLKFNGGGVAAGADYQFSPYGLLGVAAGGGPSNFSVPDRATSGTVDAGHVAAYGVTRWNAFYASGIVGFDFFENRENRFAAIPGTNAPIVPVPGFSEQLQGRFMSQSLSSRVEAGWRIPLYGFTMTPFAALQYGLLHLNGYSETTPSGPSVIGLSYASRTVDSLPMFLGTQFDTRFATFDGRLLSIWARVAWMHEFQQDRTIEPSFLVAPGFNFIINGATAPVDAARVDAGLKYALSTNLAAFANFGAQLSGKGNAYVGSGGFKISW